MGQAEEEVGLVLGLVGWAGEDPASARLVKVIAGVVARCDAVRADLAGGDEELIELEVVVAEGAGDGGSSGEVLGDEGLDDLGFEAVLLVDDVVGDVELLGYVAGVVDVVDGAAAALDCFGHAFVTGEAALVPELEGEADDLVTLRAQECGDCGGIDSSGHGDCDRVVCLDQHCFGGVPPPALFLRKVSETNEFRVETLFKVLQTKGLRAKSSKIKT